MAQNGKDSSLLYRGVQLAAAQEAARVWAADPGRYPALTAARLISCGPAAGAPPGAGGGAGRWPRPGPAAPRRARRSRSRGQVGPEHRRPAAHHGRIRHGWPRRARRSTATDPVTAVAARRGRMADRADRAGALQPARVARPAGARHPGRPVGRGDRGSLQPGRQDPGGRLPGRHDPAMGHRLASPDQHRVRGAARHSRWRSPAVARPWR